MNGMRSLRPSQIALSLLLFAMVLYEDITQMPGMAYLAVFSLLPLAYGLKHRYYLLFFPIILAFSYIPVCFIYTLNMVSMVKMAVIWPMFFAVYSILSYPDSEDLEKRATITWVFSSLLALLTIIGALYTVYPVENVFVLGALVIAAGIAMIYLTK